MVAPPSPHGGCAANGERAKNVMPNLFRHLMESNSYETLNQVQGDKIIITTQSHGGEGKGEGQSFEIGIWDLEIGI